MVVRAEDIVYWWYELFNLLLPFLTLLLLMIMILATVVVCALLSPILMFTNEDSNRFVDESDLLSICVNRLKKLYHSIARQIFRMKASPGDTPTSPKTEFFGYVVPSLYLIQVCLMAIYLAWFAGYAFIDTFFVKESYECVAWNDNLACFTTNASSNTTERVNCSTIDSIFNDITPDLQCYQFVFDELEALSAAGGILTAGVVAFTVTVTCILCIL